MSRRTLLLTALTVFTLAAAACQGEIPVISPGRSGTTPPPGTPVPGGPVPAVNTAFDPVRAAQVLGPAVGMVIVNTSRGTSLGSGFVIASQGKTSYMVTNNHVVDGARRIQVVMPDGRHYVVQLKGADALEDLAVLEIADQLPVAGFADSTKVQVGQPVLAIGSPLGNESSVTVGVISALHRSLTDVGGGDPRQPGENLPDVLQTDAPINPGNSGGPLADGAGRVVGINTAGQRSANGIGFAIPSAVVRRIADNLIAGRTPGHPYLGVQYTPVEQALMDPTADVKGYGILVRCVVSGSPAARGGLHGGDVVERIDAVDLNNGQTLGGVLQLHNPGDAIKLTALRGSSTVDLSVTLGEKPQSNASC